MPNLPPMEEMQKAYLQRDASYDGVFYLGVRTTGIFCRPSCGARKPLPGNVEFFVSPREALSAGYRPCKRCNPLDAVGQLPDWARRLTDAIEQDPTRRFTDADLRTFGVDPVRARRFFRRSYGMTFQAYCRGRRLGRALEQIRRGERIDDVALGHGFESHSGFRDAFSRAFGDPPGRARSAECINLSWIESPLGPLIAGATQSRLVLLEFTERRMLEMQFATLRRIFRLPLAPGENEILRLLRVELGKYFAGELKRFTVPVDFPGSPFQQRVWEELRRIPYGKTLSYEDLARKVGAPQAQRAVGHTNGLNRIAIVVPCHRVIAKDGSMGGYGGGVWRKQALLELECGEREFSFAGTRAAHEIRREAVPA